MRLVPSFVAIIIVLLILFAISSIIDAQLLSEGLLIAIRPANTTVGTNEQAVTIRNQIGT